MNNNRFLDEAKKIEERWVKLGSGGLLDGITDRFSRSTSSVSLECQRLHNETGTWDCCDECREREKKEIRSIEEPFKPSVEQKEEK